MSKETFLKSLVIDPDNIECNFNLGTVLSILKNYGESIKHYEKSIELDPENKDAYYCLKDIYDK